VVVRILLATLAASGVVLVFRWVQEMRSIGAGPVARPALLDVLVGFITNFLDTLGIGSFATTTAAFRIFRMVPDELIPGTLIAGLALPVVTEALLFISVVEVDPRQLTALIVVCVIGGWMGAGIVASLPRSTVQLGVGGALLIASVFMALGMLGLVPAGGVAVALTPRALALALAINFVLGALLTLGVGNYAPSLVMFSVLGMDPKAAFPIMMGSGAFVATVAGLRFVTARRVRWRVAVGLTCGGIPGVVTAVWFVQSLPLAALRGLVLVVVVYAAATLLRAGIRSTDVAPLTGVRPGTGRGQVGVRSGSDPFDV
jgi:uncharacterized membrane protein YfcA